MLPEIIHTARLLLRPYKESDLTDVLRYAKDPIWSKYLRNPGPYTEQDAIDHIKKQMGVDRRFSHNWAILFEEKVVGELIISFSNDYSEAELGYSVSPQYWSKGFATEAVILVIELSFQTYLNLNQIRAKSDSRNKASLKVMKKCGMHKDENLIEQNISQTVEWYRILREGFASRK